MYTTTRPAFTPTRALEVNGTAGCYRVAGEARLTVRLVASAFLAPPIVRRRQRQ